MQVVERHEQALGVLTLLEQHRRDQPHSVLAQGDGTMHAVFHKVLHKRPCLGKSTRLWLIHARFMLIRNSALLFVRAMRLVSSSIASTGFMSLSTLRRM